MKQVFIQENRINTALCTEELTFNIYLLMFNIYPSSVYQLVLPFTKGRQPMKSEMVSFHR